MSTSSYVPVRFVGGPKGGTTGQFAGEPKREWTPKRGGGTYSFEWDRDGDGAKLRSGVYTWTEGEGTPADGDAASAALEQDGPEKAAARLNASGSTTVASSGTAPDAPEVGQVAPAPAGDKGTGKAKPSSRSGR